MSSKSPPRKNSTDNSPMLPRRFDRALEAISHPDRRLVLVGLVEANPQREDFTPVAWADLTLGMTPSQLIGVSHTHLPKLEDFGYVTWDRDAHAVHAGPQFDDVRILVQLLNDNADELPDGWL